MTSNNNRLQNRQTNRFFQQSLVSCGIFGLLFSGMIAALYGSGVEFQTMLAGLGRLGNVIQFMFPPMLSGELSSYILAMGQTIAMALLGTVSAAILALPFAMLAARNMMPVWIIHFASFRFFDTIRSVDMLIWALVFMSAVGPGPFAGVLAITVVEFGILSKLFAEAIETVDQKPIEGLKAAGANSLQMIAFGVLPQITPVLLSNTLYQIESNTRSASILGIVGAGGIGFILAEQIHLNEWKNVLGIILMILGVVSLIDIGSSWIQRRFRGLAR